MLIPRTSKPSVKPPPSEYRMLGVGPQELVIVGVLLPTGRRVIDANEDPLPMSHLTLL
jgi:hypothetical protein